VESEKEDEQVVPTCILRYHTDLMAEAKPARRYDLDWMKALVVLMVPFMHGGIIFTNTPYLVKNGETSVLMDIAMMALGIWLMPLLFTISGMSITYALGAMTPGRFVRSRIKRLLVPFLFGLFTISAFSTYYAVRHQRGFQGSFFDFYPHYFDGWWGFGGNFPWYGHHLYFLIYLFVFSVLGLGLFLFLRLPMHRRWIASLANVVNKPGVLFLLILPVVLNEAIYPFPLWLPRQGAWHMFSYIIFLLYGFLFASHEGFRHAIHRHARAGLVLALLAAVAAAVLFFTIDDLMLALSPISIYAWGIMIAVLSAADKRLSKPNRALALLGDSALPFYIVHEPILVTVAFYVCATDLGILPKLAIMLVIALPLMVLVVALIRRVNALRTLFGLRPLPPNR
jgi:glucan biosynthesis protein C